MRVSIRFEFDGRPVSDVDVKQIEIQDYVFNGQMRPEKALVVNGTAFELRLVADIQMTVHHS